MIAPYYISFEHGNSGMRKNNTYASSGCGQINFKSEQSALSATTANNRTGIKNFMLISQ